jgi:hypothetical protein
MGVTCVGLVVLVAQRCGSVTTTTALSLFAFVNSRAPSAHFHFQTRRRSGCHLLSQSSHSILLSLRLQVALQDTAPLVLAYLKSLRDVFAQREGAFSSHLTWPPTRPQPPRQSPVHPSPPCNTCHVIRRRDNTCKHSSRHELLLHPAHATWPPDSVALSAPPDLDRLEWLVDVLQPVPSEPIKYTVQQCFERLRKTGTPPGHERSHSTVTAADRELLWLRRYRPSQRICQRAQSTPTAATGSAELADSREADAHSGRRPSPSLPCPVAERRKYTAPALRWLCITTREASPALDSHIARRLCARTHPRSLVPTTIDTP